MATRCAHGSDDRDLRWRRVASTHDLDELTGQKEAEWNEGTPNSRGYGCVWTRGTPTEMERPKTRMRGHGKIRRAGTRFEA